MAAQDEYRRMLRDEVAPALRRLGLKGSAGNFVLPDPDHHLLVGFQSSWTNTAEVVRFTVNLAAIDKEAWDAGWQPWWGKPSATTLAPVGTHMRLGHLMGVRHDLWWEVTVSTATAALAADVVKALQQFGLPALLHLRSEDWCTTDGLGRPV